MLLNIKDSRIAKPHAILLITHSFLEKNIRNREVRKLLKETIFGLVFTLEAVMGV